MAFCSIYLKSTRISKVKLNEDAEFMMYGMLVGNNFMCKPKLRGSQKAAVDGMVGGRKACITRHKQKFRG